MKSGESRAEAKSRMREGEGSREGAKALREEVVGRSRGFAPSRRCGSSRFFVDFSFNRNNCLRRRGESCAEMEMKA